MHPLPQEAGAAEQDRPVDQQGDGGGRPDHAADRGGPAAARQAAQAGASAFRRREGEPAAAAAVGVGAKATVQSAGREPRGGGAILPRGTGGADEIAPVRDHDRGSGGVAQRLAQLGAILEHGLCAREPRRSHHRASPRVQETQEDRFR